MRLKDYIRIIAFLLIFVFFFYWIISTPNSSVKEIKKKPVFNSKDSSLKVWKAPDASSIPNSPLGELIRYGRELVMHTAYYFGPKGKISVKANGMNCQNCHLYAGTKLFGNNFSLVASSYPKFRRSGKVETIADRINGCMQRSMNGNSLDTVSKEMRAIIAYLDWIGKDVPKKKKIFGSGTEALPYLNRPADPFKGKIVFITKCAICHGKNGEGVLKDDSTGYIFPPLWGKHSYNIGAGIYRLSNFAGYVKNNMPFGATYNYPSLSDEEAWDVAAFVNSQSHPQYDNLQKDWPDISQKPYDYPFGPYKDSFSEKQHKYGPFIAINKIEKK